MRSADDAHKLGVNTPSSMVKRSTCSPSPSSFSIKRYRAHNIPNITLRYYDVTSDNGNTMLPKKLRISKIDVKILLCRSL